jgi:hypothetical protein
MRHDDSGCVSLERGNDQRCLVGHDEVVWSRMSVVSIEVRGVALLRGDGLAPEWDLGACFRYALRQGTRVKAPIIIIDVMIPAIHPHHQSPLFHFL